MFLKGSTLTGFALHMNSAQKIFSQTTKTYVSILLPREISKADTPQAVQVHAASEPKIQLPNALERMAEDGPGACGPAPTYDTCLKFLVSA